MGVNGLWKLLEPVGRPVTLESLENKTLAVDVSVWLNQAVYGMRNQHGSTVPNAHLVLLFQRICKLLYYRIKPIFVFDGGVPELKKKTMATRRSMRLSARNKAQKISENVLKKYLKSRAIGNVTGKRSQRPSNVLNQQEPEKDLFELPPLPQEKEDKSPSDECSFFKSRIFQDTDNVNIDSEEFKKLPHEIQHEIIVEMHEKSKRHSRYQELHMPEESDDFSNFQLNHLLKRGKLTQRLGTIRKEMNEKRVGELVTNIADDGMTVNSIIQSQKIMSEETGHYILIKKAEARRKDADEQEEDEMAGGFFREVSKDDEVELQPFVLTDLPKVSSKIAKPSVSVALDEAASSTDESSDEHELEDIADESGVGTAGSGGDLMRKSNIISIPDIPTKDLPLSQKVQVDQDMMDEGGSESSDVVLKGRTSGSHTAISNVRSNVEENQPEKNGNNLSEKFESVTVNVQDFMKEDSQEIHGLKPTAVDENSIPNSTTGSPLPKIPDVGESGQEPVCPAKSVICNFDTELDYLEDEIHQKKCLIEKLLANRRTSVMTESQSSAKKNVENVTLNKNSLENGEDDGASHQNESRLSNNSESGKAESNLPTAMDVSDDDVNSVHQTKSSRSIEKEVPPPNEFEGITYEELGEMQMKLDEDLDNLREERSRQTRLAATVTDEMYKDSQELLQLFGIPYVVSPMEAEAQCATLNRCNLCDGSITEDSDIILFGAKKVYKNVFNQKQHAELYQEEDVKCQLGLDRVNLIAMALLTGSDYTEGVQGVGIVSAMEIINEFSGDGIQKLQNLKSWLQDKSKHQLHESKVKKKLKNILLPVGFPSQQVFEAYLNPAVDDSSEAFSWASPDLHSLRLFASEKLGWSKTKADEILLPVLKRLNSKETQSKIDSFFPVQFNDNRKIKSRRIKRVVNRLLNKETEDKDTNEQTVKRLKVKEPNLKSCKVIGKQNQKESNDIDNQDRRKSIQSDTSTKSALVNLHKAPQRSRKESDSTSDTSDEDHSYVPFNTKVGATRGRGLTRGKVGVSSLRVSQRRRKYTRKRNT